MNRLPQTTTAEKGPVSLIAGPWPSYSQFKGLPECDRWVMYSSAKAYRQALEDQGLVMAETYDAFVRRVTGELDI
ncbi:putative phage-like protein [Pseudomonas fluorescens]|jgi:hypothetical protein|uniref:Putative phage-like protein n=1 Tax=Pseudomonas fluorescens TaxID=294 RepID=A0A448DNR0_PSEFL|nr:hypothetical protein [Pseudomonas fluorescens]VEF08362.1 putative phage-like protein [Pseudomonas fluorescens]